MIIYTREIFNNSQKSRLMINNNATSGIYRVDIYNGSTKLDSFNPNADRVDYQGARAFKDKKLERAYQNFKEKLAGFIFGRSTAKGFRVY
jgi:4-alpha-glucanotransferase